MLNIKKLILQGWHHEIKEKTDVLQLINKGTVRVNSSDPPCKDGI